jgi:two-component system, OmpR family, sensor histidine kinase KdpD
MGRPGNVRRLERRNESVESGVYTVAPRVEEPWAVFATHDAKNMLGVLSSNVEWLREAIQSGRVERAELLEAVEDLRSGAARLTELLQQALQPEAKQSAIEPSLAPVNIGAVLQSVYQQTRRQAAAADVRIDVRILSDAVAMLDRTLIERVLLNLVDNAMRFAPPGSTVKVACDVAEDRLELSVTDEGPGIEKAQCERIFEPFFTTSGGAFPGEPVHAGLGLAFCRAVARAHAGDVRAEVCATRGARFVVDLPLR